MAMSNHVSTSKKILVISIDLLIRNWLGYLGCLGYQISIYVQALAMLFEQTVQFLLIPRDKISSDWRRMRFLAPRPYRDKPESEMSNGHAIKLVPVGVLSPV
jgi:hypothetical protein